MAESWLAPGNSQQGGSGCPFIRSSTCPALEKRHSVSTEAGGLLEPPFWKPMLSSCRPWGLKGRSLTKARLDRHASETRALQNRDMHSCPAQDKNAAPWHSSQAGQLLGWSSGTPFKGNLCHALQDRGLRGASVQPWLGQTMGTHGTGAWDLGRGPWPRALALACDQGGPDRLQLGAEIR